MIKQRELVVLSKKMSENIWKPITLTDLESMQKFVGGYIERVPLPLEIDMWVNEEALLYENEASILLKHVDNIPPQVIYGNVFFAAADEEGNMTSLSEKQIEWLVQNTIVDAYKIQQNNVFLFDLRNGGQ